MLELVSPAGTPEGVSAAVQNGASAVYASFGSPESMRTPLDLTNGDFGRAAEFCRQRGVRIYAVIDYPVSDGDFEYAVRAARLACRYGADAVVANDLGLIRVLRHVIPDMPVFAGEALNIHDLNGVRFAAAMGVKRVALSRQLSIDEIAQICAGADVEIEVSVHGASCPAYAGTCRFGASGGACGEVCRTLAASGVKNDFPLNYKDTCLVSRLYELEKAGVTAVRINGRERRPEYSALATDMYSRAICSGDHSRGDTDILRTIFSPGGLCEGWADKGDRSLEMVAAPASEPEVSSRYYASVRKAYLNREYQHVPVLFYVSVSAGNPVRLSATDDRGNLVETTGAVPELAFHQELTYSVAQTELLKTGGTPFYCDGVKCSIEKGLYVSPAELGKLRNELLAEILKRRKSYPPRGEFEYDCLTSAANGQDVPSLSVYVSSADQLSPGLTEVAPVVLYIPVWEIPAAGEKLKPFLENKDMTVCAALPRVIREGDIEDVREKLAAAKSLGIKEVLVSNFSHILLARSMGFAVRGDHGLNITNSRSLGVMQELGLRGVTLPLTMTAAEARTLSKTVPAEMTVYGRLPLMLTENCISKSATGVCACGSFAGLADKDGLMMPVVKEYGCRNLLLSSRRLFLADNLSEYFSAGLSGVRLYFTTESAEECVLIAKRYLGQNGHTPIAVMDKLS